MDPTSHMQPIRLVPGDASNVQSMPDEPKGEQGDSDEALEAEVTEFEAALKKHVEESRLTPHVEEPLPEPSTPHLPNDEEIEARLAKAIENAEAYLGPTRHDASQREQEQEQLAHAAGDEGVHREFADRFDALDERLDRARAAEKAKEGEKRKLHESDGEAARGLGVGLSAAYAIIGCPLLGAGIGYLADQAIGGTAGVTIGTVVGAVAGMGLAIFMLNRFADR